MNLIENEELYAKNKKSKTIMIAIIVLIVLLLLVSIGLICMIFSIQKNTLKLNIDGKSISNISTDMFLFEDDTIYISVKDFAKLVNYQAYNGDHKSEDTTKGYISNEYEEASFSLNSNKLYKTLLPSTDNEYFDLEKPVKMQNDKLYISIEGMQIASTSAISYDNNNKQFTVYTLPYLVKFYTGKFNDSAIGDEKADFSNQKALLYNMIVVKNANEKYGVRDLSGNEIIGTKYASIKFVESSKDFIVKTDDNKMGILSAEGSTKIQPDYDEIKQIDKDLNLYLVKNNNKYGVINQNGNIVIYLEYDKIGIDTTQFTSNNIKNQYLLFDNCIAVQRDKKWGLFDKTGKQIAPVDYDELGCIAGTQSNKTNNNLLIIPKYEGIVVGKDKKYGLINSTGKLLIPCVLDSIYSITTSGQDSYYMIQGDKTLDVIEYLEKYVIKTETDINTNNINENTTNQNNVSSNQVNNSTATNTVANTTTNSIAGGNTAPLNNITTNQVGTSR